MKKINFFEEQEMKVLYKNYFKQILFLFLLSISSLGLAQNSGFFSVGGGLITYNIGGIDVNSYDAISTGTYNLGNLSTFVFKGGYINTFKNSNGNVCGGTLNYRIYKQGSSAPSFTSINLNYDSNGPSNTLTASPNNVTLNSSTDQRWKTPPQNINVLTTANSSGTWIFEVYWSYNGDTASSVCKNNYYLSNNGNNYKWTFTNSNYTFPTIPTISTNSTVTNITNNSAQSGGNTITSSTSVSAKGVAYGTSASPTTPTTSDGTGTANYTSSLTSLSPQTKYFVRAYATNSEGTGYGSDVTFYTLSNPPTTGSFAWGTTTGCGNAVLNWTGATFPSSGATTMGYILLRSTLGTPSLSNGNGAAPTASAGTTIVPTGISSSTTTYTDNPTVNATYNYVLIPYTWDGTNASTYNYLTGLPMRTVQVYQIGFANLETQTQSICQGSNIPDNAINGKVWVGNLTNIAGASASLEVQFGYVSATTDSDPASWPSGNWIAANYREQTGNDDRYTINGFGSDLSAGTYRYAFRYRVNACSWVYGGFNSGGGGTWNGTTNFSGTLTVNSTPSITTQPSTTAQIVCQNAGATALTVAATGLGLSYKWYSNSSAANSGGTLISGATSSSYTPPTSSVGTRYYYVIVSGNCGASVTSNVSGAVTVNSTSSAALSSALGTNNQTLLNDGTPITPITYGLVNISGASVSELPAGVTGTYSGSTFTISGTPSQVGTFNYSISFTANCGTVAKLTGKIQVNSYLVEYANIQSPKKPQTILLGEQFDVYAQVKITGITDAPGQGSGVSAWLGYSLNNTNPNTWTNWTAISYNPNYDSSLSYQTANDEYYDIDFVNKENLEGGTYYYASRFQRDGTSEYTYGGTDEVNTNSSGGIWGTTNANGKVNVSGVVKVVDEVIWDGTQWKWFDDDEGTSGAWKTIVEPNQKLKAKIEGNYPASAPSFTCKKLTIDNGVSVTIGAGKYIRVINEIVNNNASASQFTVESDGGLIQVNDASVNTGNITVKRNANLKRLDYNYWGSPVSGQQLKAFSPGTLNSRFYIYQESNDSFVTVDPTTNFETGKGYAIRASNTAPTSITDPLATKDWSFIGIPNNGDVSFTLLKSSTGNGYNLVANPYPSNIDLNQLYTSNNTDITGTFYFWTNINPNPAMQYANYPLPGYYNNYATYNLSGGNPPAHPTVTDATEVNKITPEAVIKPGQGFIVQATGSGDGKLDFYNTHRVKDTNTKFFNNRMASSNEVVDRYRVQLTTPLGLVNTILVAYKEGSTLDFEGNYDAKLLVESPDSFYSKIGVDKMIIQGRGFPLDVSDKVELGATFYQTGNHTISIESKEGIFATGQDIYLHDKLLNTYTNLQNESYTFDVSQQGEINNRFEITYQPESTLSISNLEKEKVKIYYQEKDIVIEAYKTINEILIYDVSGKLIKSIKPKSKQLLIENSVLSNGVNVISIIFANEKINTKVISR